VVEERRPAAMGLELLGDYGWILAFEVPELHRFVDLMRELRATTVRRHTGLETPLFTGSRVWVEQFVD
jgi:peroxiredoxin